MHVHWTNGWELSSTVLSLGVGWDSWVWRTCHAVERAGPSELTWMPGNFFYDFALLSEKCVTVQPLCRKSQGCKGHRVSLVADLTWQLNKSSSFSSPLMAILPVPRGLGQMVFSALGQLFCRFVTGGLPSSFKKVPCASPSPRPTHLYPVYFSQLLCKVI